MLHHSENHTTTKIGQAIATVIADSTCNGNRITTLELVYPRYIHSELMTHRAFSRNASSSRATPIAVLTNEVKLDPVFFDYVGKNKAGMCAGEELSPEDLAAFKREWEALGRTVADAVLDMSHRYQIHKQTLNRALEPWSRIRTLVTATDWDNFFKLRLAPDAQPEMNSLALAMREAMALSEPACTGIHSPYVEPDECSADLRLPVCVARCARVSYGRANGKASTIDEDLELYSRLELSGHASPFEHYAVAQLMEGAFLNYANFRGWASARYMMFFSGSSTRVSDKFSI